MIKIHILAILILTSSILSGQKEFSLDQAIDFAVQNNKTLLAKKLDIREAQADIDGYTSQALPQINGAVDYQYFFEVPAQPVPDFITPSVYGILFNENVLEPRDLGPPTTSTISFNQPHNLTGKIEASMMVYDGAYRYGIKAAKMYKDLTSKQINASEYEVKSDITKAYLNCLITMENIDVLDSNIKVLTKSLSDMKAMYDAGFVESLDVDRLQLSFDNLITNKVNLLELTKLSRNVLKFQMGYPLNEEIILTEDLELLVNQMKLENLDNLNIDFSKRPEYDVIEQGLELNDLDYLRNRAAYMPSVRAFGSFQRSLQRANLFDNDEASWIPTSLAGLSINIPIYDGGDKKSKIQITKINSERLMLQKSSFEDGVQLQAINAQIAVRNASNTLESRTKALEMNESIYERVNIKFTEGVGSSVEVSQAEASLYEAQGAYIQALFDLVIAKADLDIALGNI
jgi:outer membrane protein TolC